MAANRTVFDLRVLPPGGQIDGDDDLFAEGWANVQGFVADRGGSVGSRSPRRAKYLAQPRNQGGVV